MKKIKILFITSFFSLAVNSQSVNVGVELAGNFNPIVDNGLSQNFKFGIHSGLTSQIQIKNNFYLSTGIKITQKSQYREEFEVGSVTESLEGFVSLLSGGDIDLDSITDAFGINTDINTTREISITTNFLQVPLMATYQVDKLQLHAGGYLGVLLTANNKLRTTQEVPLLQAIDISKFDSTGFASLFLPNEYEEDISQNSSTEELKVYDLGFITGISYTANRWNFGLYYTQGLIDYRFVEEQGFINPYTSLRFSLSYLVNIREQNGKIILE